MSIERTANLSSLRLRAEAILEPTSECCEVHARCGMAGVTRMKAPVLSDACSPIACRRILLGLRLCGRGPAPPSLLNLELDSTRAPSDPGIRSMGAYGASCPREREALSGSLEVSSYAATWLGAGKPMGRELARRAEGRQGGVAVPMFRLFSPPPRPDWPA